MSIQKFIPQKGEIVLVRGRPGTFKVLYVSENGETADIQSFCLYSQHMLGNIIKVMHCSKLIPFKKDASQGQQAVPKVISK